MNLGIKGVFPFDGIAPKVHDEVKFEIIKRGYTP